MNLIGKTANSSLVVEMTQAEYDALKPVESPIQGESPPTAPTIHIEHINQNEPGSDDYKNDCGIACVAMVIQALQDKRPSVNHLMMHYVPTESRGKYLSFAQLRVPLLAYGLKADYRRPFLVGDIRKEVEAGWPCMVLIKYSALPKSLREIDYTGSHFVLISAFDNESFRFHDPMAHMGKWINAQDLHTAMSGFKAGENLPYQGMVIRK
jgi:hypothetical protein